MIYEQLVLREYLAYRLLHKLTPRSFGVRLMRITYLNTENKTKRVRFGFVIEENDAVAKRNGMKIANVGLINAPYAEPNPRYELASVHIRLFKGNCQYDEQLQATLRYFHEKKAALYQLIDDLDPLKGLSRSAVKSYIDAFYERIETSADVEKWLIDKCYKAS